MSATSGNSKGSSSSSSSSSGSSSSSSSKSSSSSNSSSSSSISINISSSNNTKEIEKEKENASPTNTAANTVVDIASIVGAEFLIQIFNNIAGQLTPIELELGAAASSSKIDEVSMLDLT